jgi:hypothetical protein
LFGGGGIGGPVRRLNLPASWVFHAIVYDQRAYRTGISDSKQRRREKTNK